MQKHDNLAAALAFIEETGAYLFPISRYAPGPKIPIPWTSQSSNDPEQVKEWARDYAGCGFGVHLGKSGLAVLDIDDKNDKDGPATLRAHLAEGHTLPKTFKVKTPSGNGEHLYFVDVKGEARNTNKNDNPLGEGLDTKGAVGMVPAPGQDIRGKGLYQVTRHGEMYPYPDWIVEKVGKYKPKPERPEMDYDVEPDQPGQIKDAINYLLRAEVCAPGDRDNTTYRVACRMHDYAISMEMAEELLMDFWVPRCDMGDWGPEEVVSKVESAYQRASGAFGNADLSVHFKDVTKSEGWEEQPETEKRVRVPYLEKLKNVIVAARDIEPTAIPRREWLVHGRFIQGFVTLTISPGGVGKSTMSILEGLAVATDRGDELIHRKTYGQQAVWIYNLEDPQDELNRRVAAAAQHHGIDLEDLPHFYTSSGLSLGLTICREGRGGIETSSRALQACKDFIVENGVKLWIIDPLVKAHLVNENDNGAMDRLMTELSKIAMETGCAVHLVHHTRKKNNDSGNGDMDTARGASSVVSAARVAYTLNGMGSKDAAKYGLGEEKGWYLRVDDAKANLTAPADKADWFKRVSVKLPNGDWVGVLEYCDLSEQIKNVPINTQIIAAVCSLMPRGMYPVKEMAKHLQDTGEFFNEKGEEMSVQGLKNKIKDVFHITVEQDGKAIKYANERRPRSGFHKRTTDWLDCDYDASLEEGIASGRVEASKLDKGGKGGKGGKGDKGDKGGKGA